MSISSRNRILFAVGLLAVMMISFQAEASHWRFGQVTWVRVSGNTVDITVVEGYRTAFIGCNTYSFGDATSFNTCSASTIATGFDAAGESWTLRRTIVRHTYPNEGPFTVSFNSCCRIVSLINASSSNQQMDGIVDLRNGNGGSPVASIPVILQMAPNVLNTFQIPIADPDGDAFTVGMSTFAQSRIPSVASQTNTLSVSASGLLSWQTDGTAINQKYAVQVMIEENDSDVQTPLDFIIEIVATPKGIPTCALGGAPANVVPVGTPFSISVTGTDSLGDDLTVNHLGLPVGATLTPVAGTTSTSPMVATFDWTPAPADAGGAFAITITFREPGGLTGSCSFTITVPSNRAPTAEAGADECAAPGDTVTLDASGSSEPEGDTLTKRRTFGSDPAASALTDLDIADAGTATPSFVPDVAGTYTLDLVADDGNGATDSDSVSVNVNLGPEVGPILVTDGVTPLETGGSPTNVTFDADVSDVGRGDNTIAAAYLTVDGGLPIAMSATDATFDSVTEAVTLTAGLDALGITEAGVYTICIYGEDSNPCLPTGPESCTLLVVYDASAGFVTGGGHIWSPPGAYVADPGLEGFANFGFVSKYKKGATTPTGSTEFQFHAGDLNFHSTSYDWLVVAGKTKAMYKGEGTINGAGPFKFQLTAGDGKTTASDDTFRIRIFDGIGTVYDNQIGDDENGNATAAIANGSIVIHTKK